MYLIQTVQTSWRPQLPLPKEVNVSDDNADHSKSNNDMERQQHSSKKDNISLNGSQVSNMSGSHSSKKWSFGRLFRKKKEVESASSSEEDRKAGFSPANKFPRSSNSKSKSKSKNNRNSKSIGAGFDHIVVNPQQQQQCTPPPVKRPPLPQNLGNEFFLPFETAATREPYYHNQQQPQSTHHPQQQQQQQYLLHPQQVQLSRSSNSLDRRAVNVALTPNVKSHSAQRLAVVPGTQVPVRSSSEEELISLNSSTFSKYRSDESIHSGGQAQNGQSRRSRAARNERYYKRLSRDGEVSHGQVPVMYAPQPAQRWQTQPVPLSVYNAPALVQAPVPQANQIQQSHPNQLQATTSQRLRNAGSLQHVTPYVQWGQVQKQPKSLQNSVNDTKRSISYDSQIHLQNAGGRLQTKPLPPPPPPRDLTRRINVSGQVANSSSGELRPLSYAFDVSGVPATPATGLNGRCVSDDKIWASQAPLYQSAQSLNVTPSTNIAYQQPTTHRRFITRADRDVQPGKKSLPNGLDMHYIADATPRSRKPIHMLEQQDGLDYNLPPPSSGILRTTKSGLPSPSPKAVANDFWKRLDEGVQTKTATPTSSKPASSSRPNDMRSYPSPMYSEVYKPNRKPQATKASPEPKILQSSIDEVDHVVCGSLHIKPSPDGLTNSYVEIRNKDNQKSHSMPNHYQRRSGCEMLKTPNKYEEYVAEKREQHHNLTDYPPTPPQRKLSTPLVVATPKSAPQPAPPVYIPHKKPANLEEAINELEAIYKSLRLGNEPAVERKERVPTPSEFEKFALARADSYDDEDSPAGEADPVADDVAYRNMKLANLQHKTAEKQPPFGIPIGPIVPSPHNDYLHVTPGENRKKAIVVPKRVPDIIKDDLAVRALRKDAPGPKTHFVYPCGSLQKKNRATRTQSANIYSLIQRDATKPSGGDFFSFMELTKSIDRSGSLSDLQHGEGPADIPGTLQLLLNLKEQDQEHSMAKKLHSIPFRHPSQGGAICQLPEKLTCPVKEEGLKPVPMPRTSLTPEPSCASHQMEDALNKIAKDAQESSAKLTKELRELRKEALITASRPKVQHGGEAQIEQDLQEIEAVSEAAKRCGKMLLDTLPDSDVSLEQKTANKPRKLYKEGKLIEAIDQVSEAANAVCEKILKDIVTAEPPVVVQEAIKVQNKRKEENLVMPNLIKKLDPVKSDAIEAIARRCMRQISELSETTDYDNLVKEELDSQPACNELSAQVRHVTEMIADENLPSSVSEKQKQAQTSKEMDEIDRIMKECEAQVHSEGGASTGTATITVSSQQMTEDKTTAPSLTTSCSSSSNSAPGKVMPKNTSSTTASSFSSSSDCLAKSSSPSAGRRLSSSITSFNPYSSSDYIKSPSSDYHALSTDPIKTFSTTSYDVHSTSETPNITTNSTFSYSPSPPLNLTPVGERERAVAAGTGEAVAGVTNRELSSSPSQYNSSEELAMIFGIEEKPKLQQQRRRKLQQQQQLQLQQLQQTQPGNVGSHVSMSSTPSSNHASSFACNSPVACDNVVDCLNVVLVANTTTTTSPPTNANNASPCISKLDTIPEIVLEPEECRDQEPEDEVFKYSHNFNKIYASKISIIVDKVTEDDNDNIEPSAELTTALSPQNLDMTQFDSLSSQEETSSNPDSGNVSLADFPLFVGGLTNASLQLQTVYNSRFEVRNRFVSEVCIESGSSTELDESATDDFPRLPTEEELIESLKEDSSGSLIELEDDLELDETLSKIKETQEQVEVFSAGGFDITSRDLHGVDKNSINKNYSSLESDLHESNVFNEATVNELLLSSSPPPRRKKSIVYETPQLNMNILEVRHNYELNETVPTRTPNALHQPDAFDQITDCTLTLEKLNEALTEMPRRRGNQHATKSTVDSEKKQLSLLPWRPTATARSIPQDNSHSDEKPTTSSQALTVLGETHRANSSTVLENVLVACSLGVLTSNDIFTLFLIIIGVITIVAIVLF